jgi:hypothetical protein
MSLAEQVAALASEVVSLREQLQLTQDEVEQTKSEDNTFYLMVKRCNHLRIGRAGNGWPSYPSCSSASSPQ